MLEFKPNCPSFWHDPQAAAIPSARESWPRVDFDSSLDTCKFEPNNFYLQLIYVPFRLRS